MAEALLRERLGGRPKARVASAGIAALVGEPADPVARDLLAERGLDISGHRARQLTAGLAAGFDLVLVMERRQVRQVEAMFPFLRGRIRRIGEYGDFDVPDPYREPRTAFARALSLIERGIQDYARAVWRAT